VSAFLRNCWYVAARDHEIGRTPFARRILDEPVMLYRRADGAPVALEDRCCHRNLPLSEGRIEGDDVRCGYHGLRFDAAGACIEVPGQRAVPPGARVRSYPLVERWGWVWIWMGDPARADEARLPDWWWADHPEWKRSQHHLLEVACDYRLINDNVLDVTHLAFVHIGSIGTKAILEFPGHTERGETGVRLERWILDRPAPPLYQAAGEFPGNVDRGQVVEFVPPCFTVNHAVCVNAGADRATGGNGPRIHLMALSAPTPATADTTHYFFAFVRGFGLDDPALDKVFDDDMVRVFREDVGVLEAQQRMNALRPDAPTIDINVDAAPIAARNLLAAAIAAE
jgi:vanillate monooxygenase